MMQQRVADRAFGHRWNGGLTCGYSTDAVSALVPAAELERVADLSLHGWSRGDVLALIGILVAIVIAVVPPLRRAIVRSWRALLLRAGFPQRRYAGWFIRTWGAYENPYLDDRENLDLSNTYVPLSFQSGSAQRETVSVATAVLDDCRLARLLAGSAS